MTKYTKTALLAALLPLGVMASPAAATETALTKVAVAAQLPAYAPITVGEVEAAQKAWGDALVSISAAYERGGHGAAKQRAEQVIDGAYAYNMGPVLFKPTLAAAPATFRTTREGALAYFVGGDARYPGDSGFALKGWRSYAIENAGIVITGNKATSMGNVLLTDAKGNTTKVDKTWGYVRDAEGKLRIVLHHSSLPFGAN